MNTVRSLAALAFTALGAATVHAPSQAAGPVASAPKAAAATDYRVGDKLAPATPAPKPKAAATATTTAKNDYTLTNWEALVPKDWDPMKDFKNLNFGLLQDGDPRANEALERLKRAFDNAPTVPSVNDTRVRIAGFVVPLEAEGDQQMREFLLVPYFGACIHTPPPPANQIIHVTSAKPIKGFRTMDAMWASGTLRTGISDTVMGTSGYRMVLDEAAVYREPGR
jgi:hypothetical protein